MRRPHIFCLALTSVTVSACGTAIPLVDPTLDTPIKVTGFVNSVADNVKCQLGNAVINAKNTRLPAAWLATWEAEVTLTLNITEKTIVSPGVSATRLLPTSVTTFTNKTVVNSPQLFSFGLGANYTGTANRIITLTWKSILSKLGSGNTPVDCGVKYGIDGDLRLDEVLLPAIYAHVTDSVPDFRKKGPYQNLQETVSFEIDTSFNATPSWKYVQVSTNTSGNLFNVDRDRKDLLLITLGPNSPDATSKKKSPAIGGGNDVETIHNLSRIVIPIQ